MANNAPTTDQLTDVIREAIQGSELCCLCGSDDAAESVAEVVRALLDAQAQGWTQHVMPTARQGTTRSGKPFVAVGDYPDEPDIVLVVDAGGDGAREFVDWLVQRINSLREIPEGITDGR